jgi:5-methyltetrahydropteroyltriglutamate--homocysteine methyltransferase
MKTSQSRILTTHVGSLPRSAAVLELLDRRESGAVVDTTDFDKTLRWEVADVVRRQVELGIDVISDGEMSKISYATYVKDRLTGFSEEGATEPTKPHLDLAPFPELRRKMTLLTGQRHFKRVSCIGPVAPRDKEQLQQDLHRLHEATAAARPTEAFVNAASPGVIATFLANRYYPTYQAYIEAVAEAMRHEYETIVSAGFVLQIDCPDLAMSRHTTFQELTEPEFLQRAALHVEALNHALRNVTRDMVRIHVCWGNYEGPHTHDIDLRKIASLVLDVKAMALSLEAANPRHEHERAIWQDIRFPEDKILLPGVIDTSTNYVEHPDLVAQRIIRFAQLLGRERIIASTDCGFGTSAGYGKIDPEVAYLKLGALVRGAAKASEQLWG